MSTGFAAYVASGTYFSELHSPTTTSTDIPLTPELLTTPDPLRGTVFGSSRLCSNSYSAEITALIAGHLLIPHSQPLHIYSDCLGSLQVAQNFSARSRREKIKTSYHNLFRVFTLLQHLRPATLSWTKAHVGIPGNEIADTLAKAGALPHETVITPQFTPQDLAIDALYEACKLPVGPVIFPRTLHTLLPKLSFTTTTPAPLHSPSPFSPPGNPYKPLLAQFQQIATAAFRASSARGAGWHDLPQALYRSPSSSPPLKNGSPTCPSPPPAPHPSAKNLNLPPPTTMTYLLLSVPNAQRAHATSLAPNSRVQCTTSSIPVPRRPFYFSETNSIPTWACV
jgi:ribonuclease HI